MAENDVIKRDVMTLSCHFNWNLKADNVVAESRHEQLEENDLSDITGNRVSRNKLYLYLSFVFALPDETGARDLTKAEEYARKVIPENPSQAEIYVAKANLANILFLEEKFKECHQMLDEARQIDVTSPREKVTLLLLEIYAIIRQNHDGLQRGLEVCRQAIDLDPTSGEAYFSLGQLLHRLRRCDDVPPLPTDEERAAFRNAIRYWPDNALPAAYYAHCLSSSLHEHMTPSACKEAVVEMEHHLDNAMTLAQTNDDATSMLWCSKTYKQLAKQMWKEQNQPRANYFLVRQREAIERAAELKPNNAYVMHEAGNFFWRSVSVLHQKDYDVAEFYLKRACDPALQTHPNVWASIDMVKMRCARAEETGQPMEPSALQQLRDLLPKFNDFKVIKIIHMEIVKEQLRRLEFDEAKDGLRHLLQLNQENGGGDVKYFSTDLNNFRVYMKKMFREQRVSQRDHVSVLLALAETFLMFDPPHSDRARSACQDVKHLDRTHAGANRMLRDLKGL